MEWAQGSDEQLGDFLVVTMDRVHWKGKPGSLVISLVEFFDSFFKVTGLQLCSQWGTASEGEDREEGSLPTLCIVIKLNDRHFNV